jgi:uncharacterized membrane protein YdjX (TVP38/TMEM64 family)
VDIAQVQASSGLKEQRHRARWILVLVVCALIGIGTVLWRYTSLSAAVQPAKLAEWFQTFESSPWSPVLVVGIYLAGGFVLLPLTLLVAATALVFEPWLAMGVSFAGALLSAASTYCVGAKLMRGQVRRAFGPAMDRVSQVLTKRGVLAMATIRLLPVAPYSVINVAAGSLAVGFREFFVGTALGIAPGVIALSVFGQQVRGLWERPSATKVAIAVAMVVAWVAVSVVVHRVVSKKRV